MQRDRRLTSEEATKYDKIRKQVKTEFPPMKTTCPSYWDVTIFIPPDVVKRLPADCGDTYDDKYRSMSDETQDFSELFQYFIDNDGTVIGAWGAKPVVNVMNEAMDKGLTIAINKRGKMKVFLGDVMLESHKIGDGNVDR